MSSIIPEPVGPLSAEEAVALESMGRVGTAEIDNALLARTTTRWRKVAFIVGTALPELRKRYPKLTERICAYRVRKLVEAGLLESQGSLEYVGFSEV